MCGILRERRLLVLVLGLVSALCFIACLEAQGATWTRIIKDGYQTWYLDGNQKFRWQESNGQWWHWSTVRPNWYALSATGRGSTFIGTGSWYDLGNGFTYRYLLTHDYGYFSKDGSYRFYYQYGPGQWYHSGVAVASWQALGASGRAAGFVGNGVSWDLGNGFTYWYYAAYDSGYFKRNGKNRFMYQYVSGQWNHAGDYGSWEALGASGRAAGFVGNGVSWDLGNGFTYWYYAAYDSGYFKRWGQDRFFYRYATGQWNHRGSVGDWQLLGAAEASSAFMGDGERYLVVSGLQPWWYRYDYNTDRGEYYRADESAGLRFAYAYYWGYWYHYSGDGGNGKLGNASLADARFDGTWWLTYSGTTQPWYFSYDYGTDIGSWSLSAGATDKRFSYDYEDLQWKHYSATSEALLGLPRSLNFDYTFLGDGTRHDLYTPAANPQWYYRYDYAADRGEWYNGNEDSYARLAYTYGNMQWNLWEEGERWTPIGATGRTLDFIGDGERHVLVNDADWDVIYTTDEELRILYKDLPSDTGDFLMYRFIRPAGGAWYDSRSGDSAYLMSNYWLTSSNKADHLEFTRFYGSQDYRMDYYMAGTRSAEYWDATSGWRMWRYIYADRNWFMWISSSWVYSDTGDPDKHRP